MRRLLPCLSESLLRNGITMEVMNVDEFGLPRLSLFYMSQA